MVDAGARGAGDTPETRTSGRRAYAIDPRRATLNPVTVLSRDTKPAAMRAHLEMLRRASIARRASVACALSEHVILASRRALAALHPELGEREVRELWARTHYGVAARRLFDRRR